jgi:hypothetical protein
VPFVIPLVQFVVRCILFVIFMKCPNDPKLLSQSFSNLFFNHVIPFKPFEPFLIPFVQFVVHGIPFVIFMKCPNDPKLLFQSFSNLFLNHLIPFSTVCAICDSVCAVCGPLHTVCDIYSMFK